VPKHLQYNKAESKDVGFVLNALSSVHAVDAKLREEFEKHLLKLSIKKDQILFNENEVCEYMYFIVNGALMGCTTHNKQKITTYVALENDFVSSISGLHGSGYAQEYVVAVEDTDLLAIHNSELKRLFTYHFELNYIFRAVLEKYYKAAQQRAHIIRVGNAKERYLFLAKTNPGYLDRLPLDLIASLLNVKASTLLSVKKNSVKTKEASVDLIEAGRKLERYVNEHQLFRQKNIRLHSLAQNIGLSSHGLSILLNSYFKKSFVDYINQYRVNWIKDNLRNPEIMQNFTLEGLAYSAGFSSRSAFYNSFKKLVGMSPVEYSKSVGEKTP